MAAGPLSDGWSREEAEGKLGSHVQCVSNPDEELLQWGPNFPGWDRSRQPKALGRPLKVGSKGVVREILQAAEGKYRVVVHWDAEKAGDPYWTTVIGPAKANVAFVSRHPAEIVGKWREVGRSATLEFLQDGGFKAVDNEGMAVAGRYTLIKDGNLTFEIHHEGTLDEIVTLNFSLVGDELTVNPCRRWRGGALSEGEVISLQAHPERRCNMQMRKSGPGLLLLALCWLWTGTAFAMANSTPFEDPVTNLWGYRNARGAVVIPPRFTVAQHFSEGGIAAVADDSGWKVIDRQGKTLVRPFLLDNGPDPFRHGLARFREAGKIGFFDERGKVVIPARLLSLPRFPMAARSSARAAGNRRQANTTPCTGAYGASSTGREE